MAEIRVRNWNVGWDRWRRRKRRVIREIGKIAERADVILLQECREADVREFLDETEWGVWQDTDSPGERGTVVCWRRSAFDRVHKIPLAVATTPQGFKMHTRYICGIRTWVDSQETVYGSVHRPPFRYRVLWGPLSKNLAAYIERVGGPKTTFVFGIDANHTNPVNMARATGLVWRKPVDRSIDGFLITRGIMVRGVSRIFKGSSGHYAIGALIRQGR